VLGNTSEERQLSRLLPGPPAAPPLESSEIFQFRFAPFKMTAFLRWSGDLSRSDIRCECGTFPSFTECSSSARRSLHTPCGNSNLHSRSMTRGAVARSSTKPRRSFTSARHASAPKNDGSLTTKPNRPLIDFFSLWTKTRKTDEVHPATAGEQVLSQVKLGKEDKSGQSAGREWLAVDYEGGENRRRASRN
jgi:hypothetical protein